MFHSVFILFCAFKAMVAAVTVILAIAHMAVRCCGRATQLVGKSNLLAFMLIAVFSFVFMVTGQQQRLSSDRAVITLVCVQYTLKWLNWFREIMSLMLQRKEKKNIAPGKDQLVTLSTEV